MKYKSMSVFMVCAVLTLAASLFGQEEVDPKKEAQAINAIKSAATVDDRLKAIHNVLTKFPDTEFKPVLLQLGMQLERQKGDYTQTVVFAKRLLDADPMNAGALVTLASETARHVREFDSDKDKQLAKAVKWAKDGIKAAKNMSKAQATMTDDQLRAQQRDVQSQGWEALGMVATLQKKYDEAIADFIQANSIAATPDAGTMVRLGQAYEDAHRWDEASDAFDKAGTLPNASAQIKDIVQSKKAEIVKLKATGSTTP
jgi:tetratricopeptide (TPR) repeat protein